MFLSLIRVDEVTQKCNKTVREARLIDVLNNWTFDKDFDVVYMYYDQTNGKPAIFADLEYDLTFKEIARCI